MILPIVTGKDHVILRTVSKKVPAVTKKTLAFLRDMEDTMIDAEGVGIAACQVGRNLRLVHVLINKTIEPMVNPEILGLSEEQVNGEEGCLSLPGWWGKVKRAKELTVRYQTPKGETRVLKLTGFPARIVQHEVDHLNAMLFADRADPKTLVFDDRRKKRE